MLVGYARPSIRDQSPSFQLSALDAAGCSTIFIEKTTGAQRDRPELKAALQTVQRGDTLVVWKLDRLARSVRQLAGTMCDLRQRRVGLLVLGQQLNTNDANGQLIFQVFAAVAEFERELAAERSSASLWVAKALGRRGGRKPAMGPAEIARAKMMLKDSGVTVEEVARRMGVQSSTLYRHIPGGRSSLDSAADC